MSDKRRSAGRGGGPSRMDPEDYDDFSVNGGASRWAGGGGGGKRGGGSETRRGNVGGRLNRDSGHGSGGGNQSTSRGGGGGGGRRHPPHLNGKEIGLFYSRRSAADRQTREDLEAKHEVYSKTELALNSERKAIITSLLSKLNSSSGSGNDEGYGYGDPLLAGAHSSHNFRKLYNSNLEGNLTANDDQSNDMMNVEVQRYPDLDRSILTEMERKAKSAKNRKMLEFRKKLPAYNCRNDITNLIEANQVVVLSGETGCGKTTQVPQFILDKCTLDGNGSVSETILSIVFGISKEAKSYLVDCAITVAERVAEERDERVGGQSVGYSIRLESKLPQRRGGTISFLVVGVLIQRLKNDPLMRNVSHVIVDEIHERDILSDFLLVILKDLLVKRPDLKVILMSATLNAEKFSTYFDRCPMYEIPGFTFPVKEYYLEDVLEVTGFRFPEPKGFKYTPFQRGIGARDAYRGKLDPFDEFVIPFIRVQEKTKKYSNRTMDQLKLPYSEELNLDLIQELLVHICSTDKANAAVLIFLPGWDNISALQTQLQRSGNFRECVFYPLHSQLPTLSQKEVFSRPPQGTRKVIIATNIAETSITIEDVVFVIDCGKIKMTNFDNKLNLATLDTEWVSLANSRQRRGRAGRVQAGVCYHLFSRGREATLEEFKKPEILRSKLEETVLKIKILKQGDSAKFLNRLCDPPEAKSLELALERLQKINALDFVENLTPLGFHLAHLPMDPYTGRMVLMAAIFSCCDPIFSCAASLNFKDCFYMPMGKEQDVDKIKKEFSNGTKSDHIAVIRAVELYELAKQEGYHYQYCHENFLSHSTLDLLINMKSQFAEYLHEMKFLPSRNVKDPAMNVNSKNIGLVKAIICAGLYPNLVNVRMKEKHKGPPQPMFYTREDGRVSLHKKSVNVTETTFESQFLVYHQKQKSSKIYIHDTTLVTPFPLLFFGGQLDFISDSGLESLGVDGTLRFRCKKSIFQLVQGLRRELDRFLEYKIEQPGPTHWLERDDSKAGILLRAIHQLLTSEYLQLMGVDYDDYPDYEEEELENEARALDPGRTRNEDSWYTRH